MYDRYFLTTLPALALGAGLYLSELRRQWAPLGDRRALAVLIAALAVIPFAFVTYAGAWPTGTRNTTEIADHLRRHGLEAKAPNELYVADQELVVYLLADVAPPTKYAVAQHLGCEFGLPAGVDPEREIDRILDAKPRFVVISEQRTRFYCTRPDRMARMDRHLAADYRLIDTLGAAWDPVQIYQRIEKAGRL